jgi:hypothetical protein
MSRSMHHRLIVASCLLASLHAPPASAQIMPPAQWQFSVRGSSDVTGVNPAGELQFSFAMMGAGFAIGLRVEGLEHPGHGYGVGAQLDLALQWRPAMMAAALRQKRLRLAYEGYGVYNYFDPHVDIGGLLGQVGVEEGTRFRGVFYVGATLDFGIPLRREHSEAMDSQLVLSLGYRYLPAQTPAGGAHHLLLGLGWRGGW